MDGIAEKGGGIFQTYVVSNLLPLVSKSFLNLKLCQHNTPQELDQAVFANEGEIECSKNNVNVGKISSPFIVASFFEMDDLAYLYIQ